MSTSSQPPSLVSSEIDSDNSKDSKNFEIDYLKQNIATSNRAEFTINNIVTSHNVDDILSENSNYNNQENFTNSKNSLSNFQNSFVQDYNSRDSNGFSIQDILGLPQSYHPSSNQEVEPRYDYQISTYETISNSSNNYAAGVEEVSSEECVEKSSHYKSPQAHYNNSYTANDPAHCHQQRVGLDDDIENNPERQINSYQDSSFQNQVFCPISYLICKNLPILYQRGRYQPPNDY